MKTTLAVLAIAFAVAIFGQMPVSVPKGTPGPTGPTGSLYKHRRVDLSNCLIVEFDGVAGFSATDASGPSKQVAIWGPGSADCILREQPR